MKALLIILILSQAFLLCDSSAYGTCQTACNKGAMACYKLAGVVFGVGSDTACSLAQSACMTACTPFLLT